MIAGLEIRVLSALRGFFIDARWTFSFASAATVPGEGLHGSLLEGLWPASSQRYAKPP